ncbi:hypothetical protein AX14_014134 [Amanita brunnescens Koide BX004]|nr:hypothetical protein AX14_014134 [Amanita brunnescens Koide BX004]
MIELLQSISEANEVLSDTFEDLSIVLERAISSASFEASGCRFCPKARDIIFIVDRIQNKWFIHRLRANHEFLEDLQNDCRMLKELLQSIINVKEHKPPSASILNGAHDNRIDRAKFTNVTGNYTVNSFSNTFVLIKQESGIGICSVIALLTLAFLFRSIF